MTDVRTRKSKHGGTTQTADTYVPKENIKVFKTRRSKESLETETGRKYEKAYYPLYVVEDEATKKLIDGVNGEVKAEIKKLSGDEKKVHSHVREGKGKSEIMEELDMTISKVTSVLDSLRKRKESSKMSLLLKKICLNLILLTIRLKKKCLLSVKNQRNLAFRAPN